MAFYNFGPALLQMAAQDDPVMTPEKAVWRLTGEIGEWYGIDAGHLKVGGQADLVVLDPAALKSAKLDQYAEAPFEVMGGLMRVVNRHDGVIKATVINGQMAFENDVINPRLGKEHGFGRFLPRRHAQPN